MHVGGLSASMQRQRSFGMNILYKCIALLQQQNTHTCTHTHTAVLAGIVVGVH